MEYNTERKKLNFPEYGRHIQNMVNYLKTIENKEERTKEAHSVIEVMANMTPQIKDAEDYKNKLWDHLFIIADFDIDIDSPYEIPKIEEFNNKPNKIEYLSGKLKFRHYGKILEEMIGRVNDYEDGEEKDALINVILNQMKKSYLLWNKNTVKDETIIKDFTIISNSSIKMPENIELQEFKNLKVQKKYTNTNNNKNNRRQRKFIRKR